MTDTTTTEDVYYPLQTATLDERVTVEEVRAGRFYVAALALIVLAAIIASTVMALNDPDTNIAAIATLGGVAAGTLASLARTRN